MPEIELKYRYMLTEDVEKNYISKDKIRNLLPKINGSISHFKSKNDNHIVKRIKRMLENLLEEN